MAYARIEDIEARLPRELSAAEKAAGTQLLDDAGVIIDQFAPDANIDVKRIVSCRMVMRAIGDGNNNGFPMGATQGSMAGLGYSQSWTIGSGANGELYLAKLEKEMLGIGDQIGSRSPVEDIVAKDVGTWSD